MTSAYPHNDIEFKLSANIFAGKLPIGCKKWLAKESDCGFDSFGHQLAISVFNFPLEFTCDSGVCVDMQKQCNGKEDCTDGSDDKLCCLIRIPNAYDNASAPKYTNEDGNLEIPIDKRIIRIDSIDTINMNNITQYHGIVLYLARRETIVCQSKFRSR